MGKNVQFRTDERSVVVAGSFYANGGTTIGEFRVEHALNILPSQPKNQIPSFLKLKSIARPIAGTQFRAVSNELVKAFELSTVQTGLRIELQTQGKAFQL